MCACGYQRFSQQRAASDFLLLSFVLGVVMNELASRLIPLVHASKFSWVIDACETFFRKSHTAASIKERLYCIFPKRVRYDRSRTGWEVGTLRKPAGYWADVPVVYEGRLELSGCYVVLV